MDNLKNYESEIFDKYYIIEDNSMKENSTRKIKEKCKPKTSQIIYLEDKIKEIEQIKKPNNDDKNKI